MTEPDAWTAFASNLPATIAATGALIAAIGSMVQGWRAARKADEAAKLAVTAVAAASATDQKIGEIGAATDGNLSKISAELAVARQEIRGLKEARELAAVQVALNTPAPAERE